MFLFGLTSAGIAALNATPGVPPTLTLARFGDEYNYVPGGAETDIHGTAVFNTTPAPGQVLNSNTLVYTVILDAADGPFTYGELGLYLPGNVLFALGSAQELETKIPTTPLATGNTVRIDCYVSTVGSNHSIYASVANDLNDIKLTSVGSVDALPPAAGVEPNVFIAPHPAHSDQSVVATALNGSWTVESYNQPAGTGTVTLVSPTAFNVTYSSEPFGDPPLLLYPGNLLMQFTAGPATGCVRTISAVAPGHLEITNPFYTAPNAGDPFKLYAVNGTVAPVIVPPPPSGGGDPGGTDTQAQYNDGGAFAGTNKARVNKTTDVFRIQAYTEGLYDLGAINTTIDPVSLDVNAYSAFRCILGGNVQFSLDNIKRNSPLPTIDTVVSIVMFIQQDAVGGRNVTFPANVWWDTGLAPTPTRAPNSMAVYVFSCFNGGSPQEFWVGSLVTKGALPV